MPRFDWLCKEDTRLRKGLGPFDSSGLPHNAQPFPREGFTYGVACIRSPPVYIERAAPSRVIEPG